MTEVKKVRPDGRPPERRPASRWWLLAKDGGSGLEVLVVDHGDERALPVFSGEGEAEMFFWLGGAFEDGWRVRESSAGELVSILCGPCARVESVALDPSPGMAADAISLLSVGRKRFVNRIVGRPCSYSANGTPKGNAKTTSAKASARQRARASVRLL